MGGDHRRPSYHGLFDFRSSFLVCRAEAGLKSCATALPPTTYHQPPTTNHLPSTTHQLFKRIGCGVRLQIAKDVLHPGEEMPHDLRLHERLVHMAHRVVEHAPLAVITDPGHGVHL